MSLTKSVAVQSPSVNLLRITVSWNPAMYPSTLSRRVFTLLIFKSILRTILLSKSYFEEELLLKLDNAGNITNDKLVTICNNFIHSLFKQINVCLNRTLISPQTDMYHHKAYIDAVIHNDRDDGETGLTG